MSEINPSGFLEKKDGSKIEIVDKVAREKSHEHSNKSILDAITQTDIDKWNSSQAPSSDSSEYVLADFDMDSNGNIIIIGETSSTSGLTRTEVEEIVSTALGVIENGTY